MLKQFKKFIDKYSSVIVIIFFMAFVIFISLRFLLNNSIRLDESQSLWQTSRSLGKVFEIIAQDVHIPLYHTLLHLWQSYLGNGVAIARLLSLLFFVATIPLVDLLTHYVYNKKSIAFFATLLISISPFLNWYANEVRMYTLLTFLVVLNQYFFLRIFKQNDKIGFIGFLVTATLGVYTHYFFSIYLFICALFFIVHRPQFAKGVFKKFLFVFISIGLLFLPWVFFVVEQGSASNTKPLLYKPTSVDFFNTLTQYVIGFQNDSINTLVVSLWPIVVILLFLLLKRQAQKYSVETQFFITIAFVPLILIFLFSLIIRPFFVSRYLVFCIPSLYILLAYLINLHQKKLRYFLKIVLILLMVIGFVTQIKSNESPVVENYSEAIDYINKNIKYQDVFIISAPFTIYPVEYYYTGSTPINTLPIWDRNQFGQIPAFSEEELPDQVKKLTSNKYRVWLLLSYDQGYEENIRLYFDKNYQKLESKTFSKDLSLHLYQLSYDYSFK